MSGQKLGAYDPEDELLDSDDEAELQLTLKDEVLAEDIKPFALHT